jgi:hypothetical protein
MLAFPDKDTLLGEVARVLEPGGRFAFTVEEGTPLTAEERLRMPDADTVWLVELAELTALLARAGLRGTWQEDCSAAHGAMATSLLRSYRADAAGIAEQVGPRAAEELVAAHELWSGWLASGRVRKFAIVAEKQEAGG